MNIDFSQIRTAAELAAETLADAKQVGRNDVLAALSRAADAVTGPVPQAERDSWATKADAAHKFMAEDATSEQIAMLDAECAVTGESRTELAESIAAKAVAYTVFVAHMAGVRRVVTAAIEDALTVEAVQAVVDALQSNLAGGAS